MCVFFSCIVNIYNYCGKGVIESESILQFIVDFVIFFFLFLLLH